jgi:hypothetical protein
MAVNAFLSLLVLVLLLCFFYGPWQAACTDWARQIIFERRDKLFDLAAAGKLDFASEQYRSVRAMLEGMIRFSHELTWPRLLFHAKLRDIPDQHPLKDIIEPIDDPIIRNQVKALAFEATLSLIIMMALKSIFVAPIAVVLCCIAVCSTGFTFIFRNNSVVRSLSETIQSVAQFT